MNESRPRLGYLCSEYPAVSHTFVLREVEALRRRGAEIETFSIRPTRPDQLLSAADREAAATTTSILPPSPARLGAAHLRLLRRSPVAYLKAARLAMDLAPDGFRARLWQTFYLAEAVQLWAECEARGIRHVHAHLANVAADVALLTAAIGSAVTPRRPWSWSFTMHGPTEFSDVRRYRLAEKAGRAAFVVCISEFARSQLMLLLQPESWGRLRVVHMGVPVTEFKPPTRPRSTAEEEREILYIGRLVPEKGQAVLLEAVAGLVRRGHPLRLTIAGEGPTRASLEELAAELGIAPRVTFLGAVGQDRLRELYEAATIFCLPSFAEGVPVVLMEAMAMGVPVVSTQIAGIPELIEHGRGGLLAAPGSAPDLSGCLERLLAEPGLSGRVASEGRRKVEAEFDVERSAERLLEIFDQHLGA